VLRASLSADSYRGCVVGSALTVPSPPLATPPCVAFTPPPSVQWYRNRLCVRTCVVLHIMLSFVWEAPHPGSPCSCVPLGERIFEQPPPPNYFMQSMRLAACNSFTNMPVSVWSEEKLYVRFIFTIIPTLGLNHLSLYLSSRRVHSINTSTKLACCV